MVLNNKIALITGANRGLGKAIAEKFASEGAVTVLVGRKEGELRNVQASIEAAGDADHHAAPALGSSTRDVLVNMLGWDEAKADDYVEKFH